MTLTVRPTDPTRSTSDDATLARVLDLYLADVEAGRHVDAGALVAAHPEIADRLRRCLDSLGVIEAAASTTRHVTDATPSTRPTLGDYRIVREVGRGGMGVVYEAEQLSLCRRVALKVLPFAAALDPPRLARFKLEAQAAAQLHHTNIVPVYSVGVERGVHYYAMQFIEGRSLAEVICDLRGPQAEADTVARDLTEGHSTQPSPAASARLSPSPTRGRDLVRTAAGLAIQAALALEHAHRSGVLHRDIKPANLLIDHSGRLWVTDFGLARLGDEANLTLSGDVLGTLRYMSPERASGSRLGYDQRADVYSLGVTLYELLTLCPAFDGQDRAQLLRRVANEEPRPPRALAPAIPADLETILLKAIAKEPASRYATAQEFADDLSRFLEHRPIRARRPSLLERAAKWSRRHAGATGAAAAVLLLSVAGLLTALALIGRERDEALRQQAQAQANFWLARDAVDQMLTEVGKTTLASVPQMALVRRALLEKALGFYLRFLNERGSDPAIRLETGRAYRMVGQIRTELGDSDAAAQAYPRAIALLETLAADRPRDPEPRAELAIAHRMRATLLAPNDRAEEADKSFRQAVDLGERLVNEAPGIAQYRTDLATTLNLRAMTLLEPRGRHDEAQSALGRASELLEALASERPNDPELRSKLGATLNNMAMLLQDSDRHAEARTLLERAITHQRAARAADARHPMYRRFLRNHYETLTASLQKLGENDAALATMKEVVSLGEELVGDFPFLPDLREELAGTHGNYGAFLLGERRFDDAERAMKRGLEQFEALMADFPRTPAYRRGLASASDNLGLVMRDTGRAADAELSFLRALEIFEDLHAEDRTSPENSRNLRGCLGNVRTLLVSPGYRLHDPARALGLVNRAIELEPKATPFWSLLGLAAYRAGDWDAAIQALEQSSRASPGGFPGDGFVLAMAHWQRGEHPEARALYNETNASIDKYSKRFPWIVRLRAEAADLIRAMPQPTSTQGADDSGKVND
jgi:serine/threonine protein kinase/Tfp pilus assembly protein PilF